MAGIILFSIIYVLFNIKLSMTALIIMIDEQVWLGLIVSIVCVTVALIVVDRPRNVNLVRDREHTAKRKSGRAGKQYLYVFGNLMSQS
jgi:hypothetical protein